MKRMIMASITAVVVIAVLAGALMPILNDATAKEDTFTNEGYFYMEHYDATTDHTISWSYEKPATIVVDSAEVPIGYNVPNGSVTVVADTNWIVRMYTNANGVPSTFRYLASTGNAINANVSDSHTFTMTFTSGALSGTFAGTTISETYDDLYVPVNDGPLVMKKADKSAMILGDSVLVAYGMSAASNTSGPIGGLGFGISMVGSYDDGITGTVWRGGSSATLSGETVNVTPTDHVDMYELSSITAVLTVTDSVGPTDNNLVYNYLIVPAEVTAERSVHFTDGENAIFNAIPVMVIVALLLGVIALVLRSRMD